MGRRDYGSGSITSRGGNRWLLRWYTPPDPVSGERHRHAETFTGTKRDAMRRLVELTAGEHVDSDAVTLARTIELWRADAGHAPGTARNYDLAVTTIPAPFLAKPIGKIRAGDLRTILDHVNTRHGIHRTRQVHAVISGALTYAWRHEWITGNPARRVQPPAQPRRKAAAPTAVEVRKLLTLAAHDPELHAWIMLSTVLGSRRSEALALHWSDIDLDRGQVAITKALDPVTGAEKATKTENERTVAIGADTVAVLHRWRLAFLERAIAVGEHPVADPYVFTSDIAGAHPWRPDLATKRFGRLRAAAADHDQDGQPLPDDADRQPVTCRLHDLRHYVATELLAAGVPVKVVSDRLGHTRTATTTDLYGHAIPASDQAAANLLEQRLAGS